MPLKSLESMHHFKRGDCNVCQEVWGSIFIGSALLDARRERTSAQHLRGGRGFLHLCKGEYRKLGALVSSSRAHLK